MKAQSVPRWPREANRHRLRCVNAFGKILFVAAAAPFMFAGAAHAADLPLRPAPKAKQEKAVPAQQPNEFDRLGADCLEATDGCRRFTRAGDGLFDAANNIGIACQPKPLSCTKRK